MNGLQVRVTSGEGYKRKVNNGKAGNTKARTLWQKSRQIFKDRWMPERKKEKKERERKKERKKYREKQIELDKNQ